MKIHRIQRAKFSNSGQVLVEYVLTVVFVGLVTLGTYAIFRYALAKYYLRIIGMLSSFLP